MDTRTVPTPRDIAPSHRAYDRKRWEAAVLASTLPRAARTVALVLAHHAGVSGQLPAGGVHQEAGHLAADARTDTRMVRRMLTELELRGWISRPDSRTWQPQSVVRPITLTHPDAAVRQEPPSPGGRP